MNNFFKNIFKIKKKLTSKELLFQEVLKDTKVERIFKAISNYNEKSKVRYVGGCVRKIINDEKVDDIDLATNINPQEVKEALSRNNIKYFETGLDYGTITANIDNKNFEITSLRKDVLTDGRHAVVEFTSDWMNDAGRRDFTINAIYADKEGNLFDPYDGKKDLKNGKVTFIGDSEKRIKEDYLRILRYIRFFLNYSRQEHQQNVKKSIKKNLNGINNLSKERLIGELEKIIISKGFLKLCKDKFCKEIILIIFPQLKYIDIFKKLNKHSQNSIDNKSFIFLLSLLIIDETDNSNYFLYKFNLSKENKKRINFLRENYLVSFEKNFISKKNFQKIFYFYGKSYLIDLIDFKLFKSNKNYKKLIELKKYFKNIEKPLFHIKANVIMEKYKIKEGKELGNKLKYLENLWIENSFKISDKDVDKVFLN